MNAKSLFPIRSRMIALALASCFVGAADGVAADKTWDRGQGNNGYSNANNWDSNGTPGAGDAIIGIDPGLAADLRLTNLNTADSSQTRTVGSLTMGLGDSDDTWTFQSVVGGTGTFEILGNVAGNVGTLSFRNSAGTTVLNVGGAFSVASGATVQFGINTGVDSLDSVTVAGTSTITGTLNVRATTAAFNGGISMAGGTANLLVGDSGTGTVSAASLSGATGTIRVAGSAPGSGTSSMTLSINGTSGSASYAGTLSNGAASTELSISKTGAGTQTLSGSNSYSGGTAISGGTLIAGSTSALGSGAVTVSGGVLDLNGTGTPLQLTIGTDFVMTSGTLGISLVNSASFDGISGSGSFSITGGNLVLDLGESFSGYGDTYAIFQGFSGNTVSGLNITGYDSANFTANLGTNGTLSFTAVPEPGTMTSLGIAAVIGLMLVARRRNRAAGRGQTA